MTRHVILTPEHVLIELPPAGLGSRFLALVTDGAIVAGVSALISTLLATVLPRAVAAAVAVTLNFVLGWGYHMYFEVRHHGRSPGKRLLGLRVVDGYGLPLTFQQSFVRNVARALDLAPFAYGLGALVCRLDPLHRRLGDILANTLVIREARPIDYDRRELRSRAFNSLRTPRIRRLIARRIPLEERELLLRLVERAEGLDPQVRFELMQEIGDHYRAVLGLEDPSLSGENLVRGLAALLGRSLPAAR